MTISFYFEQDQRWEEKDGCRLARKNTKITLIIEGDFWTTLGQLIAALLS